MKISVVTINYNNADGLEDTIKSVVCQSYSDFEYIIIDGGSTDGSVDVIRKFENEIDYWVSEKDTGIYHAMNKGVTKVHGDYCVFLNSGDKFYNNSVIERIIKTQTSTDIFVGKVTKGDSDILMSPPPIDNEITFYHLFSCAIPHQGAFIRTELLHRYPFDETLKISSDWKFFVQTLIMDNCSFCYIDEFVTRYDMGGVSSLNPDIMRDEKIVIMRNFFPPRVLADYYAMKSSECLTQTLTKKLKQNYRIDKFIYKIGLFLLKLRMK